MNKHQAQEIIKETFEAPFDKARFIIFIKNLFNSIDESKAFHARGDVKEMFKNVVKTYERIGTFTTPSNEKVDIMKVAGSNLRLTYVRKREHSCIACFAQNLKAFSSCAISLNSGEKCDTEWISKDCQPALLCR